jgi:hypothetical protein
MPFIPALACRSSKRLPARAVKGAIPDRILVPFAPGAASRSAAGDAGGPDTCPEGAEILAQ